MRKYVYAFMAMIAFAVGLYAHSVDAISTIGPASSSSQVTIPAAGTSVKNCLTDLDAISSSGYTLRVLDGGTTMYAMAISSNVGIVRSWSDNRAMCGSANTDMTITVSSGTYNINYLGFTRK